MEGARKIAKDIGGAAGSVTKMASEKIEGTGIPQKAKEKTDSVKASTHSMTETIAQKAKAAQTAIADTIHGAEAAAVHAYEGALGRSASEDAGKVRGAAAATVAGAQKIGSSFVQGFKEKEATTTLKDQPGATGTTGTVGEELGETSAWSSTSGQGQGISGGRTSIGREKKTTGEPAPLFGKGKDTSKGVSKGLSTAGQDIGSVFPQPGSMRAGAGATGAKPAGFATGPASTSGLEGTSKVLPGESGFSSYGASSTPGQAGSYGAGSTPGKAGSYGAGSTPGKAGSYGAGGTPGQAGFYGTGNTRAGQAGSYGAGNTPGQAGSYGAGKTAGQAGAPSYGSESTFAKAVKEGQMNMGDPDFTSTAKPGLGTTSLPGSAKGRSESLPEIEPGVKNTYEK